MISATKFITEARSQRSFEQCEVLAAVALVFPVDPLVGSSAGLAFRKNLSALSSVLVRGVMAGWFISVNLEVSRTFRPQRPPVKETTFVPRSPTVPAGSDVIRKLFAGVGVGIMEGWSHSVTGLLS